MKNLALAALLLFPAATQAKPKGHLAYVQNNVARVSNLTTGAVRILPRSARTQLLSLSPRGPAVYFVTPPGQKTEQDGPPSLTGYLSVPPYKAERRLPAQLQGEAVGELNWSPSGKTLWIRGFEFSGAYTPATNSWTKLNEVPTSVSNDGKRVVYFDYVAIRVRDGNSNKERVIFSPKQPQALFNAIKSGKNQKKLRDFADMIDPQLWKSDTNWAVSTPALAPDGSRLYFASNAGTGQGAAGNSTWAIFAADLKTGKIAILSTLGPQFGRMPDSFKVSPDGKRLLAVVSVHSSAVDNPCYALVVDLLTQKSREILANVPESKGKSNMTNGACWSPDGKYVAISAYFYDVAKLTAQLSKNENIEEPSDSAFTLYIKDAATGRTVRRIKAATLPSWAR